MTSPDEPDHDPAAPHSERRSGLRIALEALAVVLILAAAAGTTYYIQVSEPTAEREAATRRSAALVETLTVTRGDHTPTISALGLVRPAREVVLSPRVGGEIIQVDPSFLPGGRVNAGAPLLQIDPADYEQALVMRESEVRQVQAELAIEEGQQRAARLEFELLGEDMDEESRTLVLREPQIASLRAKLSAAQASLAQAHLDLERTRITTPFDALILDRSVELGSQVNAGDPLARIVATDEYWVMVTVPLAAVPWIALPDGDREGARVRVRHRSVWEAGQQREGRVRSLIGEVDQNTRLARLVVSIERPLDEPGAPRLVLGSLVQVELDARGIDDVVRLERAYLRRDDTVWVMDGGELQVRPVEVAFSDSRFAYVRAGLDTGEKVITTNLATVSNGLEVREAEPVAEEPGEGP